MTSSMDAVKLVTITGNCHTRSYVIYSLNLIQQKNNFYIRLLILLISFHTLLLGVIYILLSRHTHAKTYIFQLV